MLTGRQYIDFRGEADAAALADRLCDELGMSHVSDLRAAKAAQQAQAEVAALESEAQARRDAEVCAERERAERAQRDAAAAEARQREQERIQRQVEEQARPAARQVGRRRALPWRPVAIVAAVLGMIALAVWVLPQMRSGSGGLNPSLPPGAFVRQTSNAAWTPYTRDFDGVTMVLVPAGCFMMGSDDSSNEQPVLQQCFDEPFWIDETEVTQADFARLGG
jgi:formylglycine-generating enzyme required for sulfatase activity